MDTMAKTESNDQEAATVARTEELVDRFLDAIWMERGLSQNTLGAYRADLMTLGRGLAKNDKAIDLTCWISLRSASNREPNPDRQPGSFRASAAFSVT